MKKLFILLMCAVWLCCNLPVFAADDESCTPCMEEIASFGEYEFTSHGDYDEGQLLAWMTPAMVSGGTSSDGVSCLSGTYAFHWKPTYSASNRTTACVDNGVSTITGTQTGGDLTATSYLADGADERIEYTKTIGSGNAVTIYMRIKVTTVNTEDGDLYGQGIGVDDGDYIISNIDSTDYMQAYAEFNDGIESSQAGSGGSFTKGSWHVVGITYREDSGAAHLEDFCACIDTDCDTANFGAGDCDNDNPNAFGTTPTTIYLGDNTTDGRVFNTDDDFEIDKMLIIESWQASQIDGW